MTSVLRSTRRPSTKSTRAEPKPHEAAITKESYNGFANYETWAVSLWMNNDYESYRRYRSLARDIALCTPVIAAGVTPREVITQALAQALREELEEGSPTTGEFTVYADLLRAAFSEVDWYELAEELISDNAEDYE